MVSYLSEAIDYLYGTYSNQLNQLVSCGYTKEEAFWIHLVSVPFMLWSEQARNLVPLSHVLKFYTQVYRDEIVSGKNSKPKTTVRCLLKSRLDLAYALAKQSRGNESILKFAFNIGRCALPHVNDTLKNTLAGLFIINTIPISRRFERHLPLGRLIWDINENTYLEKPDQDNYATAKSCCKVSGKVADTVTV